MRFAIIFLFLCLYTISKAQDLVEFVPFAEGFRLPVDIVHADDSMLYIVEKRGTIKQVDPSGEVLEPAFLDIRDRVNDNRNERGLLGLCFHPEYPDSAYFFTNYTNADGHTVISRFELDSTGNFGNADSEKQLLLIEQPFINHNAGDLLFGPDGYLYIPTGDGGDKGDPLDNSQNFMSLLGKILRIDIDLGNPYSIPPDNPYADDDFAADEIWAIGLRNPWRADFDPLNGDLYIADVGQNAWEEINVQADTSSGGENYGWRCYEGFETYNPTNCPSSGFTFPVHAYAHTAGSFCRASITGGVVYRGDVQTYLYGKYLFADYCTGMVGALYRNQSNLWQADTLAEFQPTEITSFGRDIEGEIYMAASNEGRIYQIVSTQSAIEDVQLLVDLKITNPVRNQLDLSSISSAHSVEILEMNGRVIQRIHLEDKIVDVSNLQTGLYLLRISDSDRVYCKKFVKI